MDRATFWKNFELGKELDISGRFIYNGLKAFDEMQYFDNDKDIFEILYNLSVGLERLFKICVIMIEHENSSSQEEQDKFERSLITHSHMALLERIKVKYGSKLTFSGVHNKFLQILVNFYISNRYGRYGLNRVNDERKRIIEFIEKGLDIKIEMEDLIVYTQNDIRIKKYIGKIVGTFTRQIYGIICDEATRLNIYTYELESSSKAAKIFLAEQFTFDYEDRYFKELMIYFINTKDSNGILNHIRSIPPLEFDPGMCCDYLQCLKSDVAKLNEMESLKYLYEDIEDPKERKLRSEGLDMINNPHVYFEEDEEEEDDF